MTKRVVALMILNTWISPALISFLPIFAGWYSTEKHQQDVENNADSCSFIVNKVYAVVSSSISFWIPCTIMLFTYYAIFREANRQEKQLALRQGNAMLMHRHSSSGPGDGRGGTNGEIIVPSPDFVVKWVQICMSNIYVTTCIFYRLICKALPSTTKSRRF